MNYKIINKKTNHIYSIKLKITTQQKSPHVLSYQKLEKKLSEVVLNLVKNLICE